MVGRQLWKWGFALEGATGQAATKAEAVRGELALRCEKVYGPRRDIEWAFQEGTLYLLQCRAVTTGKARSGVPDPGPPRRDPVASLQRVEFFAGMDRRQSEQI